MSRGGRGGGPAGIGRMGGQALPFDIDTALEDQVALNAYQNDDWANSMFPVSISCSHSMISTNPPIDYERAHGSPCIRL